MAELTRLLGSHHITTAAYHPQANGLVERFHRQLGDAFSALRASQPGASWYDALPLILLSLRSTHREALEACPAELLYGDTLRLPGDMVAPADPPLAAATHKLVADYKTAMAAIKPPNTAPNCYQPVYLKKTLPAANHVYLRIETPHAKLSPRYSGPHRVLDRLSEQVYRIETPHGPDNVSTCRLKPAPVEAAILSEVYKVCFIRALIAKLLATPVVPKPILKKKVSFGETHTKTFYPFKPLGGSPVVSVA